MKIFHYYRQHIIITKYIKNTTFHTERKKQFISTVKTHNDDSLRKYIILSCYKHTNFETTSCICIERIKVVEDCVFIYFVI